MAKVGINGCGRIGRICMRTILKAHQKGDNSIQILAVNDLMIDAEYMAYLIKHDTTHGTLDVEVKAVGDMVYLGEHMKFKVVKQSDPSKINWGELGVEFVIESTGRFTKHDDAAKHLVGGAKKVIISAPSEDSPMFVYGVNHDTYDPKTMDIVSNASCTTNCLAPLAKILNDSFTIQQGLMTTIHAMTATQLVVDGPSNKDWRGGRSASANIIPSSTGAAKAVGKVIPALQGKLTGMAFRVPVINVSIVDLTVVLAKPATKADIDNAVKAAAYGPMKGIVEFMDFDAVSSDFNSTTPSCIYDSKSAVALDPKTPQTMFKVHAWYDNEASYCNQLIHLIAHMHKHRQ